MKYAGNGRTAKDAANDFCKTGIERLAPETDAKCWQKTLLGALTLSLRMCVISSTQFDTLSKYMYLISTFSVAALSHATLLRNRLRFSYFAWFWTNSTTCLWARARWWCLAFHANTHRGIKHGGLAANPTTTDEAKERATRFLLKSPPCFLFPFSCCCDLSLRLSLSLGSGAEVGRQIGGHSWICSALAGVPVRRAIRSHTSLSAFPLVLRVTWKQSLLFFLLPCCFVFFGRRTVHFLPHPESTATSHEKLSLRYFQHLIFGWMLIFHF